jgi:hypothetical protein
MPLPTIKEFINYNPKVGPSQLLSIGYPGSGKSNHASSIISRCLERPKEIALMHGDIACEWRHYLVHSKYVKGINLVLPKDIELEFIRTTQKKLTWTTQYADYSNINIIDHIETGKMTVIYDGFLTDESKTSLWAKLAKQLYLRKEFNDHAVTYLCHEAHQVYPQSASGEQWKSINDFCSYFAHFRKRLIRSIMLAHIESEVFSRVRQKCYWRVYRDAFPTNPTHRKIVKKYIFKMAINKYHLFKGDLYVPLNKNPKMKEISGLWLLIPRDLIQLNGGPPTGTVSEHSETKKCLKNIIKAKYATFGSLRGVASDLGISTTTVKRYIDTEPLPETQALELQESKPPLRT